MPDDTPTSFAFRAYFQAAVAAGLPPADQKVFANRNVGPADWISGDPTPRDGSKMHNRDIALSVGKRVAFQLSPSQQQQLAALAGR